MRQLLKALMKVRRFLNAIYTLYSVQPFPPFFFLFFLVSPFPFFPFFFFSFFSVFIRYFNKAPIYHSAICVLLSRAGTRIMHKIVEIAILRDLRMR